RADWHDSRLTTFALKLSTRASLWRSPFSPRSLRRLISPLGMRLRPEIPMSENAVSRDLAAIRLLAWPTESLCVAPGERRMRESQVRIGNPFRRTRGVPHGEKHVVSCALTCLDDLGCFRAGAGQAPLCAGRLLSALALAAR